jgi:hypothetical protein
VCGSGSARGLGPPATHLLHEQKDAVPPHVDAILDFVQLQRGEVLSPAQA